MHFVPACDEQIEIVDKVIRNVFVAKMYGEMDLDDVAL